MIAVVLLSQTFFPQHFRAGELTQFADKVKYTIWREEQIETCIECKEKGYDIDCNTCTGSYRDLHKRHTCRKNYKYWKDKIDRLKEEGGVLSVRQWIGKPYQKPGQEVIIDIPAEIVGVQKLELCRRKVETYDELVNVGTYYYEWSAKVEGYNTPVGLLAENDGLTKDEFKAWFTPVFDEAEKKHKILVSISSATILDFAIIHFTKERY